jgi:hypothetical protein
MSRLDVELTEAMADGKIKAKSPLEAMLKLYKLNDPNKFLKALGQEKFPLPQKTRDIYYYLPERMLNIYPTVEVFSNLNTITGQLYPNPLFYQTRNFVQRGDVIDLGAGLKVDVKQGLLISGNQKVKLNQFIIVEYDNKMQLRKKHIKIDENSNFFVIYMKSYHKFLVLDRHTFNSTYIKLFVLEEYNKNLFTPVILSPLAKVYKLNI